MKLAVGIPAWADLELAVETIASVRDVADVICVADGWIEGVGGSRGEVEAAGLELVGDDRAVKRLLWAAYPAELAYDARPVWVSQSQKRTALLDWAREEGCDWLLELDADERLENPGLLRPMLEQAPHFADVFPVPFEYAAGEWYGTLWKCVRVDRWRRWVAACDLLEYVDRSVYLAVAPGNRAPHTADLTDEQIHGGLPWISHHPAARRDGRRELRIGDVEHDLEPISPSASYLPAIPTLHAQPFGGLQSARLAT